MSFINLTDEDKKNLQKTARKSIEYGLIHQSALPVNLNEFSETLQSHGASFVTLNINKQLRGCIGTLEAYQPLITDVSEHAYDAAFKDPRFPPLTKKESAQLEIHISILTPSEEINFISEKDLLAQLQPGIDGLILQSDYHKATFLPSVWEQLTTPEDFLIHLKLKAGLGINDWPEEIQIARYKTINL